MSHYDNISTPEEEREFERMEAKKDNINPDHYKVGGIENNRLHESQVFT